MDVPPPNDPIVGGDPHTIFGTMYPANAAAYRIPIAELVQNDRTPPISDAQKLIYERGRQMRDLEYERARDEMERSTGVPTSAATPRSRQPRAWDSYAQPTPTPRLDVSAEREDTDKPTATTLTTIEDDEIPRGRRRAGNAPPSSLRSRSSSRQRQQRITHSRAASPVYTAQQQQRRRKFSTSRSSSSSRRQSPAARKSTKARRQQENGGLDEVEELMFNMDARLALSTATAGGGGGSRSLHDSTMSARSGGGGGGGGQLPPLNTVPLPGNPQPAGLGALAAAVANPLVSVNRYVANLTSNQKESCFLCNTHVYFIGQTNLYQVFREFTDKAILRLTSEFDSTIAQYVEFYDVFRQYAHQCGVDLPYMDTAKFMDHFVIHTLTPEAIKHELVLKYMGLHEACINGCLQSSLKRDAAGRVIGVEHQINPDRAKFLIVVSNQLRAWMNFDAVKNNIRSSALLAKGDELMGTSLGIQAAGDTDANNILPLTHSNSPMSIHFFKMLAENGSNPVKK
jgi:hypothetical protein